MAGSLADPLVSDQMPVALIPVAVGARGHSTWTIRITSVAADVSINPR